MKGPSEGKVWRVLHFPVSFTVISPVGETLASPSAIRAKNRSHGFQSRMTEHVIIPGEGEAERKK